jgi:hypothetical protein
LQNPTSLVGYPETETLDFSVAQSLVEIPDLGNTVVIHNSFFAVCFLVCFVG